LSAATGILAALLAAKRPARVNLSISPKSKSGRPPRRPVRADFSLPRHHRHPPGHSRPAGLPCEIFPCKDGYVSLIAPQIEQWLRFVEVLGTPGWTKEPRYRNRRAMAEDYPTRSMP